MIKQLDPADVHPDVVLRRGGPAAPADRHDLRALEGSIGENPGAGKVIARTGGVRKLRFAPPSWRTGKRGTTRVCYVWLEKYSTIGLFLIYPKNEKDTLSTDDENACRLLVDRLDASVRKAGGHGKAH